MMEKIKVVVFALIWAIIAQMAIRAKAEIARTGVYPTPPIPGSFRDKTAKAIHRLCCKAVEVVLTYYHLHKGLGTVFHGVHINGDRRKEVINDFVEFSLGNDYLGFIPSDEGTVILVHGTMDGGIYYRLMDEAVPIRRDAEVAFETADRLFGGLEKRFLVSCYNGTKNGWFGQWNVPEPTMTPIAITAINDGELLAMGLPAELTQMLGLPIAG